MFDIRKASPIVNRYEEEVEDRDPRGARGVIVQGRSHGADDHQTGTLPCSTLVSGIRRLRASSSR
jgi:hypothetical protein